MIQWKVSSGRRWAQSAQTLVAADAACSRARPLRRTRVVRQGRQYGCKRPPGCRDGKLASDFGLRQQGQVRFAMDVIARIGDADQDTAARVSP